MDHAICNTFSDNLRNSENLDSQPEQVADQSLPDSEEAATWSFCALVRGREWDPSLLTTKPGNEGPNLVIDFRPLPMGDCNYMPIVVNIAQDLNNLYIVLYKNWSQIKKNRDWSRNSDALPTNTYRFSASELRNDQRSSRLNF